MSHLILFVLFVLFVVQFASINAIFNCPPLPPHVPANVTDLRPGSIKVLLAMGDSITAAFGAHGASAGFLEARGLSHSMGGDPNATTMANFLKFYSPNLQGPSVGEHFVELCAGTLCPAKYHPEQDVLNSAQSGATVTDLITHELDYLVKMLEANPNISMQNDWKLLTLFIGGNDLCDSCVGTIRDPKEFGIKLALTLENIRRSIPRVFVQIMEIFNVSQVYELSLKSPRCMDIHRVFDFECDCVFKPNATATRALVDVYSQEYNAQSRALAAYYQALGDPSFTVVTQPYGRNTALKDFPISILSDLDCFHPSVYGHQTMAVALWNNMLTPAASKKTSMDINDTPICPTADTLIYAN